MTESKTQWSLDKRDLLYYFDKCRYLEEKVKHQEFEIERLKKQLKELQDARIKTVSNLSGNNEV